jgi:hypothetical protein
MNFFKLLSSNASPHFHPVGVPVQISVSSIGDQNLLLMQIGVKLQAMLRDSNVDAIHVCQNPMQMPGSK